MRSTSHVYRGEKENVPPAKKQRLSLHVSLSKNRFTKVSKENMLWKYVMETRKENGQKYPPKTIFNLLTAFQRFMRQNKSNSFSILDQNEPDFVPLQNVMDSFF